MKTGSSSDKKICGVYLACVVIFSALPIAAIPRTASSYVGRSMQNSRNPGEKIKVTPEALLSWRSSGPAIAVPMWMRDSKRIVLGIPDQKSPAKNWITTIDVFTGQRTVLTEGSEPQPSPDGTQIAYLFGSDKDRQLWLISTDGRNARALTHNANGLTGGYLFFAWSPDSKQIAYSHTPDQNSRKSEPVAKDTSSVFVYGGKADLPPPGEVWVVNVKTGAERKLTSWQGYFWELSWFPDGKDLLVSVFSIGTHYRRTEDITELRSISVASGEMRTLATGGGLRLLASASPDGQRIAYYHNPVKVRYPMLFELAIGMNTNSAMTGVKPITPKILFPRQRPVWSPDSSGLYFSDAAGAFSQLFFVSADGKMKQLTRSASRNGTPSVSPDGRFIAWMSMDTQGRKELRMARANGDAERVAIDFTPELAGFELVSAEEVRWKSRDGLEIAGILVKPADYQPGKKYPLLVDIHGGPLRGLDVGGQILMLGPLERQMWAAKGFVVFAPDYRSGGVYGWDEIIKGAKTRILTNGTSMM